MTKSFFNKFTKWQNYVHYLLLAIGVYIWHAIPFNEVVEQYYLSNPFGIIALILWWGIGLLIMDTIIHGIFWILPKPYQWRD